MLFDSEASDFTRGADEELYHTGHHGSGAVHKPEGQNSQTSKHSRAATAQSEVTTPEHSQSGRARNGKLSGNTGWLVYLTHTQTAVVTCHRRLVLLL